MYNNKITRDEFVASRFLTIRLIDLEKSLIHRNFVFEIVTDRSTELSKKNYGELKRFTTELTNRFGMQQFSIEHHMRSSEQKKQLEILFKKLNNGYLMTKDAVEQGSSTKRNLIRNYLYNLFYNNIENPPSDDEENEKVEVKNRTLSDTPPISQISHKKEERRHTEEEILKDQQAKQGVSNTQISKQDKRIQMRSQKVREDKQTVKELREDNARSYNKKIFKTFHRSKGQKQQQRSKSLFRGLDMIWVKEGNSWSKKWISIENNMLTLVNSQQKQIIILKQLDIIIAEEHYRRIQITHDLLAQPIELRLRDISDFEHDHEDLQDYVKILTVFKETIMTLSNYHDEVVNFVAIQITNKKNKFSQDIEKKPAKQLLFKIIHQNQTIEFTIAIDSSIVVQVPITNHYGKLDFEVIEERQAGIMPKFREYSIAFSLPVQNIYDQLFNQKPKKKATEMKYFILGSKLCNYSLKLEYFERGNKWSYCSMRTEDRFEGEKPPVEFSRDEFRIQKNRFKRILYSIESYLNYFKALKNMEYPLQSYIFYFILTMAILLFDNNYSLHYIIAILAGLLIYNHPNFPSYCRQIAVSLHLSSYLDELSRKIKEEKGWGRPRVHFKKQVEKKRFLEQFKFTRKKQGSIVQKYQRLHLWLLRGQLVLTELVTLSEKVKNIFLWYHHRKTKELLFLLLAVLAVIVFVPIKLLLLGAVYKMFRRGLNHRTRTREINKYILMEIFQNLVEEFNLVEIKAFIIEPNKLFDRRSTQYQNFQRKIKEWLSANLMIDIDSEVFNESRCMKDLIFHLSDCRKRFLIPEAVCRRYKFSLEWSHQKNTLTKLLKLIYGFIVNIPSDRNILGTAYEEPDKDEGDSEDFQDS